MDQPADITRRIEYNRMIELERADAARQALERAAVKLETHHTNDLYHRVLKLAARLIRAMKPS